MKTPWYYTINQFMVRTVDNFRKTMELTKYHRAALNEMATTYPLDTDYDVMLTRYTPAHQQFMAAYTRLNMANGALKGSSLAMRQQLTELRKLAQQWWVRAQAAGFGRDSDELEALFPRGLKPFSNGAIDDKIANVNVLAQSMQPHAVLDALRLEITRLLHPFSRLTSRPIGQEIQQNIQQCPGARSPKSGDARAIPQRGPIDGKICRNTRINHSVFQRAGA
jgi:hypothetical protein